ncbi:MAG: GNAT family N-acetyltransferase [Limisphaerales bacterium]
MTADLELLPLPREPRAVARFLRVPYGIYANDPRWVAPLLTDLRKVFSPANPLFQHAEMQLWVARRGGRDVGRVAGIIDRNYNEFHGGREAFFGFFECEQVPATALALLDQVRAWAAARGMDRLLGPMNPTTNDECGLLVDGFDTPPVLMMPYNPPYYAELLAVAGFAKAKDLLAFDFKLADAPLARYARFKEKAWKRGTALTISPITRRNLAAQLVKVKAVYNTAWEKNWGFVPMTDAEMDFMAARLKPLLTEGLAFVAESGAEPVGFLLALPDFNEALQPLRGRLLSPGLFRALPYFLGWRTPRYVRVLTLGVKAEWRRRGVEALMLAEGLETGVRLGFERVEASWILEDNLEVRRVIEMFGGTAYKTYRVFARETKSPAP